MTNSTIRGSINPGRILRNRRMILLMAAFLAFATLPLFDRLSVVLTRPLGDFTVNRYSRIEPSQETIRVRYILDMAEIPAFTEMLLIDTDNDGEVSFVESNRYSLEKAEELSRSLYLKIDGSRTDLTIESLELVFPPGQGGLNTMRLVIDYSADVPGDVKGDGYNLDYRDDNFTQKIGWKELVIQPSEGLNLRSSTAPTFSISKELTEYPKDMLTSPPGLLDAQATIEFGPMTQRAETQQIDAVEEQAAISSNALSSLISADKLSLPVIVLALLVAGGLGAVHAMTPGHGKTIMAAYLVGTRGTAFQALILGGTVTITHTIGVLALGMIVLYASTLIAPEAVYSWLSLASGVIVLGIGGWLLFTYLRQRADSQSEHEHSHHHHGHSHDPEPPAGANRLKMTWTTLTALGITGGLVPSASALVILLAAISLQRIGFGIVLILAFGIGMAGVLSGIGLALVYVRTAVERIQAKNRFLGVAARFMPLATALVVLGSGLFMSARSVMQFA